MSTGNYLQEATSLLWPDGTRSTATQGWRVVPHTRSPRLVVPAGPRAASAVVKSYSKPKTTGALMRQHALAVLLRSGLGARVYPELLTMDSGESSLVAELSGWLGTPCTFGLSIGKPRANRKPVLTLVDARGRLLGFAKLGRNALTDELVRAEVRALRTLARLPLPFAVPEILLEEQWQGHPVLVVRALPVSYLRRSPSAAQRVHTLRSLASIGSASEPLDQCDMWMETMRLVDRASGDSAVELRHVAAELARHAGLAVVPTGAWHGDWHPDNMAQVGGRVYVWDWERFATGVPHGCDALHYELQRLLTVSGASPGQAIGLVVRRAPELLRGFQREEHVLLVTLLYLLHLWARYDADGQATAGARMGGIGRHVAPVLRSALVRVDYP